MSDCIFCKIIAGTIPCAVVAEDEYGIAFLDIAPFEKGHTLVIPKYHAPLLEDLPLDRLERLMGLLKLAGAKLLRGLPCDGYNIMLNNGSSASQEVPHLHFHLVPRYEGRSLAWKGGSYDSPAEMGELAAQLKSFKVNED